MEEKNLNSRLETFCDGVFAIALTLLIIDIKAPTGDNITCSADLWKAVGRLGPSVFAFLLSFCIILISWANHHMTMTLISKSSYRFLYANGFLLLSIVFFPFPTSMLADNILTNQAVPAVVLYSLTNLMTNIGWILILRVALSSVHPLSKNQHAHKALVELRKKAYMAFFIYSACVIGAFWYPKTVAVILTCIWIAWLVVGINVKEKIHVAESPVNK